MNEKEFKEAAAEGHGGDYVCSVTNTRCSCERDAGSCRRHREPLLDRAPDETLRWVRTACVRLDGVLQALIEAQDCAPFERRYPLPEVRDWERRVRAMVSAMEEVFCDPT